jgi:K(+)-stimulated pyrophosphate-energized sodium pump
LNAEANRMLRMAAAQVMGIGTQILITGYADKTGAAGNNVELARRRAAVVRDALVKLGVAPERIRLQPPADVTGGENDAQARRVEIIVRS